MRIVCIGDIHGKDDWRWVVENETYDLMVFVGDYFDSYDKTDTPAYQIFNFNEILRLKMENPNKYVILLGNHDIHYIPTISKYSGYQAKGSLYIYNALFKAIYDRNVSICYKHDDIIFSHAGISRTWAHNNEIQEEILVDSINNLFYSSPTRFDFTIGPNYDDYGNDITQPPTWIRPESLLKDHLPGYRYVVGHTKMDTINIIDNTFYFIDTLETNKEYLVIDDGAISTKPIGNFYRALKNKVEGISIGLSEKRKDLLINFLIQNNGRLSSRALSKEFVDLGTDDVKYIEENFMEHYVKTGPYHFKQRINKSHEKY